MSQVPVAPFRSVQLRGKGHVALRYGQEQRVNLVSGSQQYTRFHVERGNPDTLKIDACIDGLCPDGYAPQIEIVTPDILGVAAEGSGASFNAAAGFPGQPTINTAINGDGHIDVRAIHVEGGVAAVNGAGEVRIYAEQSLTASVSQGGTILYWGHPQVTPANAGGTIAAGD